MKKLPESLAATEKKRTFAAANQQSRLDPLAQLVEHNTFNVGVLGSSPKRITPSKDAFLASFLFVFRFRLPPKGSFGVLLDAEMKCVVCFE